MINGRTIHTYHTEGAGGGHGPRYHLGGRKHCLPSSTNPTNPYTVNTFDEHLDITMVRLIISIRCPKMWLSPEPAIGAQTMAAEDIHDRAISMLKTARVWPDKRGHLSDLAARIEDEGSTRLTATGSGTMN